MIRAKRLLGFVFWIFLKISIAASSTSESFQEDGSKAVKWLFFSGCRAQRAFPVVSLEPAIAQDAVGGVESYVLGRRSFADGPGFQIKNVNSHLPEGSKLLLSLHNGPKAFVVTGAACALYGACYEFEENSCCSWPGSKQNAFLAAPFRILCPVSAPYHGMYMNEAPEKLIYLNSFKFLIA